MTFKPKEPSSNPAESSSPDRAGFLLWLLSLDTKAGKIGAQTLEACGGDILVQYQDPEVPVQSATIKPTQALWQNFSR
jgi:hypothetical protein